MSKKKIDYLKQYKNPKWQKIRLEILQRDNFACQICGEDESELHVHHRNYIYGKNVWEYEYTDLITLCNECHQQEKLVMKDVLNQFVLGIKRTMFSSEIISLDASLAYMSHKSKYPNDVAINALCWILENNFDQRIEEYFNAIKVKG